MTLPVSIQKFNSNDNSVSIEEFIIKYFTKTKKATDCVHMSHIKDILMKFEYKLSPSNTRKKFETLKIGEYDAKHCSVDGVKSSGFKYVKYINPDDDGIYDD